MTAPRYRFGGIGPRPSDPAWWTAVVRADTGRPRTVVVVQSDRYPDHARVELSAADPALDDWVGRAKLDQWGAVRHVELAPHVAPRAPRMSFVEVCDTSCRPPAISLLAVPAAGDPTGTLVRSTESGPPPIGDSPQLGLVRWYPATLEIDQVYVEPAWRRRGVGTALTLSVAVIALARGWPRPWSDAQRTELGERFRAGAVARHLAADRGRFAAPLTAHG